MQTLLIFRLDNKRFACQLSDVQRVIWAVEITPLPGQTGKVRGVVNVEEVVVPIVDIRQIVGLSARPMELDDDIVVVQSAYGPVGMVVDTVEGVSSFADAEWAPITNAIKTYAAGILKLTSEMIIVIDPSKMITAADLPTPESLSLLESVGN